MDIQIVEKLSLHEQFRLVEIAHETRDPEIRAAAMQILQKYLNPLVMVVGRLDRTDPEGGIPGRT